MTREFLKKLGIEDKDTVDSIMAENGKDINAEKSKYADYDTTKQQLEAANKQIEEFGKLDYEGVKKSAEEYKAKFEQSEKDAAAKLSKLRFDNALDTALAAEKPKNVKMLRAMIDQDKLKFSESDNKIIGLDEQLKAIRKDNAFLFAEEAPVPDKKPFFVGNYGGSAGNTSASAREIMGLPPEK